MYFRFQIPLPSLRTYLSLTVDIHTRSLSSLCDFPFLTHSPSLTLSFSLLLSSILYSVYFLFCSLVRQTFSSVSVLDITFIVALYSIRFHWIYIALHCINTCVKASPLRPLLRFSYAHEKRKPVNLGEKTQEQPRVPFIPIDTKAHDSRYLLRERKFFERAQQFFRVSPFTLVHRSPIASLAHPLDSPCVYVCPFLFCFLVSFLNGTRAATRRNAKSCWPLLFWLARFYIFGIFATTTNSPRITLYSQRPRTFPH